MKLVLIEWLDAHSGRGWHNLEGLRRSTEVQNCQSVGWLLEKTKQYIVLVPHLTGETGWNNERQGCGDMAIPTASVVRMTVLNRK